MRVALLAVVLIASGLHERTPVAPPPWTAMTFNVLFDANAAAREKSVDLLGKESPDVLCLQEVTKPFVTSFESRHASTWPYRQFEPRKGTWGIGIASKHPLRDVRLFEQEPYRMPAMEAVVTIGEQDVRVVCVHLFPAAAKRDPKQGIFKTMKANARLRKDQAVSLANRLKDETRPVLLLGDFNEGRGGNAMDVLAEAGFENACASCGATWPGATSRWPAVAQIDHILVRDLDRVDGRVVKGGGSDHYAVGASFSK